MKKALIIYLSRKGTTKYFAHNIAKYVQEKDIDVSVVSMHDSTPDIVSGFDYILLGCWTHGLFIVFQHPEKQWLEFMKKLPEMKDKKVGLFTTYKLSTGSMFRNMEKPIATKINKIELLIKSKGEEIDDNHKALLDKFFD